MLLVAVTGIITVIARDTATITVTLITAISVTVPTIVIATVAVTVPGRRWRCKKEVLQERFHKALSQGVCS